MRAIDFTTYFIPTVTPAAVQQLRDDGFTHAIIGMDSAPASAEVVRTFLDAGFSWDAYRVIYSDRDASRDVDDLVKGILNVYSQKGAIRDLPGIAFLDIEERPGVPSQAQVITAAERLDYHQIGPGNIVQTGCYSGKWVWDAAGWGNWSYLADKGYWLWANAKQPLWGGWTDDLYIGHQTAYDQGVSIGDVDYSDLRDRSISILKQPF